MRSLGGLIGLLSLCGCSEGGRSPADLNVLLISIDTLRADHLSVYGYERDTSPNLRRFANRAWVLERAYVQWPKTVPSMASMLTSTYGSTNGVRQMRVALPDHLQTLAEVLQSHDYRTSAVICNAGLGAEFGFDRGFDRFIDMSQEELGGTERWRKDLLATEKTREFLRQHAEAPRPFFHWLHLINPHGPYAPPPDYAGLYLGDQRDVQSEELTVLRNSPLPRSIGGIEPEIQVGRQTRLGYYIAEYDAEIRAVDQHIGAILKELNDLQLTEHTLVVVTADHGESLGEHNYYFAHGRLPYDDTVHVPLLLFVPGQSDGRRIPETVGLIDLMPTLLEFLRLRFPPQVEGLSLGDLLGDQIEPVQPPVYTDAGYKEDYQRMIRSYPWKLIYVPDSEDRAVMQGTEFELYHLGNDPGETQNLIDKEPEVFRHLRDTLLDWASAKPNAQALPTIAAGALDPRTEAELLLLGYLRD
jgi:arylsulfatase A-like enzyme